MPSSAAQGGDPVTAFDNEGNLLVAAEIYDPECTGGGGVGGTIVMKFGPCGELLWEKCFGLSSSEPDDSSGAVPEAAPEAITSDPSGDVIVTGLVAGVVDAGCGMLWSPSAAAPMPFVVVFGPDGTCLLATSFGPGFETATDWSSGDGVGFEPSTGRIILTGGFEGTIHFPGTSPMTAPEGAGYLVALDAGNPGKAVWAETFGPPGGGGPRIGLSVVDQQGPNDGIAVAMTSNDFPFSTVTVARFGLDGSPAWSKTFGSGSPNSLLGGGVAIDPASGAVWAVGQLNGTMDFGSGPLTGDYGSFVVKLPADGGSAGTFATIIDPTPNRWARVVAVDGAGQATISIGGPVPMMEPQNFIMSLIKLAPEGTPIWSQSFAAVSYGDPWGIAVDAYGNVGVSGTIEGTLDLGGLSVTTSPSASALFAGKLSP